MFITFIVAFRESLEAFLMVGILIAYLRQLNASHCIKWLYMGVIAGLLAAGLAAIILELLVSQFNNDRYRLLLTAGIMLLASGILTYMAIWMQKQAREAVGSSKAKLQRYLSSGNLLGIVLLAFISVWREAMETILFFSALVYSGKTLSWPGGLLGFVLAIGLIALLLRGTRQVPIAQFFRWSSLLLIIIAAGLLSSATNILQGVHWLPGPTQPLFNLSTILSDQSGVGTFVRGLFGYDATPSPLQFALWGSYLVIAVALWQRTYGRR